MDLCPETGYLKKNDNGGEESTGDKKLTKTPKLEGVKRKYSDKYLSFGFDWCGHENEQMPQCLICYTTFSNRSMKPKVLRHHFESKHENLNGMSFDFFKKQQIETKSNKIYLTSVTTADNLATEASYSISLQIAKTVKSYAIGETLLLPAVKDVVKDLFGSAAVDKLNTVSLSSDKVSQRIDKMASNVKERLIQYIKKSKFFAIQLDESTDLTQLLTYVRYEKDNIIDEEFLFCEPLPNDTNATEIYKKLNEFFSKYNIEWKRCVGICSDREGIVTKANDVSPGAKITHCSINREALAASSAMPQELKTVLELSIKVVNFIKSHGFYSDLFSILCNEMGSEHKKLFHTEVRWLYRGKVLTRLFENRSKIKLFLTEHKFPLAYVFTENVWLARLGYLADIFGRVNDLNLSLQGTNTNTFTITENINAAVKKLKLTIIDIKVKELKSLPTLDKFIKENELILQIELMKDIEKHCNVLIKSFRLHFPENLEKESWIRDPFSLYDKNLDKLSIAERDQLVDICCNGDLKSEFKKQNLSDFWLEQRSKYEAISDKALKFLMPFVSSNLCEVGYSALLSIKNKYGRRLDLEPSSHLRLESSLRLKLTKIKPNITYLMGNKRLHHSQ